MESDVKRWLTRDGEAFLRDLGIKKGQVVLDFGCGAGHYAIPAAKTVGKAGKVYALDKDKGALAQVMQEAKSEGIDHIVPVATSGELNIRLEDESVEAVLLFDTLHYMTRDERRVLYHEVHRVLSDDGLLLVYPKHHRMDHPFWNFKDMSLEEVVEEIEWANFCLDRKSSKNLLHNDSYNAGVVLHFKKVGSDPEP